MGFFFLHNSIIGVLNLLCLLKLLFSEFFTFYFNSLANFHFMFLCLLFMLCLIISFLCTLQFSLNLGDHYLFPHFFVFRQFLFHKLLFCAHFFSVLVNFWFVMFFHVCYCLTIFDSYWRVVVVFFCLKVGSWVFS